MSCLNHAKLHVLGDIGCSCFLEGVGAELPDSA